MLLENSSIFESTRIAKLNIANKLVVAPMTRVSGNEDGTVGPLMEEYYQDYAKGGFGLIITEGLYTDQLYSQGYFKQPGIATGAQAKSWQPVVEAVHAEGGSIIAQLMHAGALSQYNRFNDKTAGPSAVQPLGEQMPFYYGEGQYPVPQAMTLDDIEAAIDGFVQSAVLAKSAGFDGVEIHGANGYLLDQFLTDYTNQRDDEFGGSVANRLRIYQRIIEAVRQAVGDDFIVGVRFSQKKVNDTEHVWAEGESAAEQAFKLAKACGADYIHTTEPVLNDGAFADSKPLAELAKQYSGLPVIANGGVNDADLARKVLKDQQADLIALGKIALSNPNWPNRVREQEAIEPFDFAMLAPIADLDSAKRYFADKALTE